MGGFDGLGLTGRVALVTGAGAGIGKEIARWLGRAGCVVAINDIDPKRADAAVAELAAEESIAAIAVPADVRDESAVAAMVATTIDLLGGLDVAVNNAGMNAGRRPGRIQDLSAADAMAVIVQNLLATTICCAAEARAMTDGGSRTGAHDGIILNVSSGETTRPAPGLQSYGAAKAAINHLTLTLAAELGPWGIRVNSIAPGTTLTETVRAAFTDAHVAAVVESVPLRRMTEPDELGRLAVLLASDLARCVTGQFILADAGAFLSRSRPANLSLSDPALRQ